jgi:hypothetical protein
MGEALKQVKAARPDLYEHTDDETYHENKRREK